MAQNQFFSVKSQHNLKTKTILPRMHLGVLAKRASHNIHRNSKSSVCTSTLVELPHCCSNILKDSFSQNCAITGVIFPVLCSNCLGFGPRSSCETSLTLPPCVSDGHQSFVRSFESLFFNFSAPVHSLPCRGDCNVHAEVAQPEERFDWLSFTSLLMATL